MRLRTATFLLTFLFLFWLTNGTDTGNEEEALMPRTGRHLRKKCRQLCSTSCSHWICRRCEQCGQTPPPPSPKKAQVKNTGGSCAFGSCPQTCPTCVEKVVMLEMNPAIAPTPPPVKQSVESGPLIAGTNKPPCLKDCP